MQEEILKRIDLLAQKLGTTANQIWAVLVSQARLEMFLDIGWAVFCAVGAYFSIRGAKYYFRKDDFDSEVPCFLLSVLSILAVLVAAACVSSAITEGVNPHYWALKQIIGGVSK